jgi:TP901 family phage tail tape measure protein
MAVNKGGVITKKDVIEDEVLEFGPVYAKNLQIAVDKNKEFVSSILEVGSAMKSIKNAYDNSAYLKAKEEIRLANLKAILSIREQNEAEKGLEKTRQESLRTQKLELDIKKKEEAAKKQIIPLTIEERVQNEINNRALKQAALEKLGLVGAYQKLNQARTDAKNKLRDLITAEGENSKAVKEARAEFDRLDAKVRQADRAVGDFTKNVGNYPQIGKLKDSLKDLIAAFGLTAGIGAFVTVLKGAFDTIRQFDQSIADLKAITGASGDDLDFLKKKAIELGVEVKGGAKNVVEAYKLIASAKPELLSNVEDLNKVTEAVITLSQASGLELPDAATRLTDALNQFGAPAEEAAKFVDALAAGAKFGSAEIPEITDALLKFGAVARSSNIDIKQSTALIELLAENGLKGAEAGTALRNVLLNISAPDALPKEAQKEFKKLGISLEFLKNTSIPLEKKLEALKPLLKNNASVVNVFGKENSVAAINILEHTERLKELNLQLGENGVGAKQAEERTNTMNFAIQKILGSWDSYILKLSESNSTTSSFTRVLFFLANNFDKILDLVVKVGSVFLTYLATMKAVNFTISVYKALQEASTAAQIAFTTYTGLGTAAMKAQALAAEEAAVATKALNVATKATPWGVILGLLTAVVAAYIAFNDSLTAAEESQARVNAVLKEQQKQASLTAKANKAFHNQQMKQIEEEFAIKRARSGASVQLDQQEIDSKKKVLEIDIDFNNAQIESNTKLLNQIRKNSDTKLKILREEFEKANKAAAESTHYGAQLNAQKAEKEYFTFKEATQRSKNALIVSNNQLLKENKSYLDELEALNQQKSVKDAETKAELDAKEKARLKKLREDYLKFLKDRDKDEFELNQFRLQRARDLTQEIVDDEKKKSDERIESYLMVNQLDIALAENATAQKLKEISRYDDKVRDLTDKQIQTLITGTEADKKALATKVNLSNDEILVLEQLQAKRDDIERKRKENTQKIIDFDVEALKKKIDAEVQSQNTELNNAIAFENGKFNAVREGILSRHLLVDQENKLIKDATEEHERQVFEIKKLYAKQALETQIKAIEDLLKAQDVLPENERISAEKRKEIENQLSQAKRLLSEEDLNLFNSNSEKRLFFEQENFKKIEDASTQLSNALQDLANSIFDAKISQIDQEIAAEQNKYDKQLELAGNDQRQKDLIQKESEKKREELENKKRKEQHKQAVFNKALAITDAGINTAKAVTAALSAGPGVGLALAIITAAVAAVQLAAIVATPIPKYKGGRKGGPAEFAYVGDGGRAEVIEKRDGRAFITPSTTTLTYLEKGDKVHSSVEDYNRLQRAAMMASIDIEGRKLSHFQASQSFEKAYGKEIVDELKKNTKAVEKQRPIYIENKIDIPHRIWASKNTNWN